MKRNVLRALAWDAFYQVVDNWVFRILMVLTLVPIALTFVIGLREEGIVLFFGLKTWGYSDLLGSFLRGMSDADRRALLIEFVLQIVFDFLAGSLGMLLALAATSFFVPRMLEKGAADLYFHKPVSRWLLYLSRYFAGLLFVALVGALLVGGMYLGLLLGSGHNDPGILVAALSLTYVFALVYSFSMLAGVVTRSTVASILLGSFFFFFNGCIHQGWIQMKQSDSGPRVSNLDEADDTPAEAAQEASDPAADGGPDPAAEEEEEQDDDPSALLSALRTTLDVLHYLLPKTSDADFFGQKLRRALQAPEFREEGSLVTLFRLPDGVERLEEGAPGGSVPASPLRELLGEPRFAAAGPSAGDVPVTCTLWRRPRERTTTTVGERVRTRTETQSQAAEKLEDLLAADPSVRELEREREVVRFGSGLAGRNLSGTHLRWKAGQGSAARTRSALLFKGADEERIYTLVVEVERELAPEALAAERERFTERMGLDWSAIEEWYPRQLGVSAPLPYNVLFSIGSSVAFALALLVLGWWRLSRISF